MSHFLGLVFAKSDTDVEDLLEKYAIDTEGFDEPDEDGSYRETHYDWYNETNILYTKDGELTSSALVSEVDWDKTCRELEYENRPKGWVQLESITEDEDGWTDASDYLVKKEEIPEGESGWTTYIKKYVAKLLEEDEDAEVYGINYHE